MKAKACLVMQRHQVFPEADFEVLFDYIKESNIADEDLKVELHICNIDDLGTSLYNISPRIRKSIKSVYAYELSSSVLQSEISEYFDAPVVINFFKQLPDTRLLVKLVDDHGNTTPHDLSHKLAPIKRLNFKLPEPSPEVVHQLEVSKLPEPIEKIIGISLCIGNLRDCSDLPAKSVVLARGLSSLLRRTGYYVDIYITFTTLMRREYDREKLMCLVGKLFIPNPKVNITILIDDPGYEIEVPDLSVSNCNIITEFVPTKTSVDEWEGFVAVNGRNILDFPNVNDYDMGAIVSSL